MSDDAFLTLYRRLGEYRDLVTAQKIVALLEREQGELDLPRLAPDTKLTEVPHEAFGLNASWWGRVVEFTREYLAHKKAGFTCVGYPQDQPPRYQEILDATPFDGLTVKKLHEAYRQRERFYHRLPQNNGPTVFKIESVIRAAGFTLKPPTE